MAKQKVLVTGGTGYIGSHTVIELQRSCYDVFIIDNLSNSDIGVLERIEEITGVKPHFFKMDLRDEAAVKDYFTKNIDMSVVVHFAALKSVSESVDKPFLYHSNNVLGLLNLVGAMMGFNIDNIVFSSSCTVYGQPDKLPVTEKMIFKKPESPYGSTKQICELILMDTSENKEINSISLRYFNPIGAHESGSIGELQTGIPTNLIPNLSQAATGKMSELKVFGNDYDTQDGTCVRDYIHVVDVATAHVKAVDRLLNKNNKKSYEVFNIGTGRGYTVMEVLETFEKVAGLKLNYNIVGRRPGDVEKIYADVTLARKELGWESERNLEDMLSSAWKWEQTLSEKIPDHA